MKSGALSRRAAERWKFGWVVETAIAMGWMSSVGLAGFVDVANAGDLRSAAQSGGASDVAGGGGLASAGNPGGAKSGGGRSGAWTSLWATREQQAQRLLESQRPAEAAALFGDPRRRAYAELQAGQYERAAQQLAPFKDMDSEYNRGNALAHAGKLQDALAAYDAALAQSPGNSDVSRNRELVARALEEQNRAKQKPNGGNSQGDSKGSQDQSNSGQQGDGANAANGQKQDNANSDGQSQSGGRQQAGNQGQPESQAQAANQPQPGKPGQSGNQPQPGNQAQSAKQAQAGNPVQQGNPAQSQPGNGAQPNTQSAGSGNQSRDDLSEAARLAQRAKEADSAATKAQGQAQAQTTAQAQAESQTPSRAQALADTGQRGAANSTDSGITADKAHASVDETPPQPRSEQALALDQWLRGIPEDSGELLRRKFMIEHMMKQQGYQP
jgi:Ca-activated chloride channel family protein